MAYQITNAGNRGNRSIKAPSRVIEAVVIIGALSLEVVAILYVALWL